MLQQQQEEQQKGCQNQNQNQSENQKLNSNDDPFVRSIPISTSSNVWFGNDKKPMLSIPKQIALRHNINRPCKVAIYDLQNGIFIQFLHYNKRNWRRVDL